MIQLKTYDNGLRLILESSDNVHSINMAFLVGSGSKYEDKNTNGLSHFIEHMMYKGTDKYNPFDIANIFESYGASYNAFTGKEYTCFYVKSIDDYGAECFALMSDLLFKSTFPADELDKERKVIVEELNMGEDNPEGICSDLLSSAVYGDTSLGQTIIGSKENILRFNGDDVRLHMSKFYVPNNMVISFTGNITMDKADEWVKKYVLPNLSNEKKEIKKPFNSVHPEYKVRIKDCEQANIAISFPSVKFEDPEFYIQSIMNIILGNGMSSRLFQEVREKQGLAYSIYSIPTVYEDNGYLGIYLNINKDNTKQAVLTTKKCIDDLVKDGITQEELDRAKVILKSSSIFSEENIQNNMLVMARYLLLTNTIFDMDEKLHKIESVTLEQVKDFAGKLFDYKKASIAYVGRKIDVDIQKLLLEEK